jgi:hypothetical protein
MMLDNRIGFGDQLRQLSCQTLVQNNNLEAGHRRNPFPHILAEL